jgi:hypothetical protein
MLNPPVLPGHFGAKPHRLLAFLVLAALLAPRCAKEVTIDLPEEGKRLVVISHFTDGQPARVKVSFSQPVHDAADPEFPNKDLDVSLSSNGVFLDKLRKDTKNEIFWYSKDTLQAGIPYTIVARMAGFPVAEGTSTIPVSVQLDRDFVNLSNISTVGTPGERQTMRIPITISVKDLPAQGRYFAFRLSHETDIYDTAFSRTVPDYSVLENTFFSADGRTVSLLYEVPEPIYLLNDTYWADGRTTLYLTANVPFRAKVEQPRRLFLEWRTLSKEFYRYHLSLARQSNNNTPLADPDAIFNNVKNGYGSVSGYAVRVDTIAIPY